MTQHAVIGGGHVRRPRHRGGKRILTDSIIAAIHSCQPDTRNHLSFTNGLMSALMYREIATGHVGSRSGGQWQVRGPGRIQGDETWVKRMAQHHIPDPHGPFAHASSHPHRRGVSGQPTISRTPKAGT